MKLFGLLLLSGFVISCGGSSGGGSSAAPKIDACSNEICKRENRPVNSQTITKGEAESILLNNVDKLSNIKKGLKFVRSTKCIANIIYQGQTYRIEDKFVREIFIKSYDEKTNELEYVVTILQYPKDNETCLDGIEFREKTHLVKTKIFGPKDVPALLDKFESFGMARVSYMNYVQMILNTEVNGYPMKIIVGVDPSLPYPAAEYKEMIVTIPKEGTLGYLFENKNPEQIDGDINTDSMNIYYTPNDFGTSSIETVLK